MIVIMDWSSAMELFLILSDGEGYIVSWDEDRRHHTEAASAASLQMDNK